MVSKLVPTALLACLLVFGVFQMAVSKADREPYPAIYQPSFAGSANRGSNVEIVAPRVVATFDDGSTAEFADGLITGETKVSNRAVFDTAFRSTGVADDPETIEWMVDRLTDLSGGLTPVSVTITWLRYSETVTKEPAPPLNVEEEIVLDLTG